MNRDRSLSSPPCGWFGEGLAHTGMEQEDVGLALTAVSGAPFALIDDQQNGEAVLFTGPVRIFKTHDPLRLPALLDDIRRTIAEGTTLVGFLSYRAGQSFDAMAAGSLRFAHRRAFATRQGGEGIALTPLRPVIGHADYERVVGRALNQIRRGDLYQVNLTFPATIDIANPFAFYACVRDRSRAPFGAFIHTSDRNILSFSPELFFQMEHGRIEARPMKGTARRGCTTKADRRNARQFTRIATGPGRSSGFQPAIRQRPAQRQAFPR